MSSVIILEDGSRVEDQGGTKTYSSRGANGEERAVVPGSPGVFEQITQRPKFVDNAVNSLVPGDRKEMPTGVRVVVANGDGSGQLKFFP